MQRAVNQFRGCFEINLALLRRQDVKLGTKVLSALATPSHLNFATTSYKLSYGFKATINIADTTSLDIQPAYLAAILKDVSNFIAAEYIERNTG